MTRLQRLLAFLSPMLVAGFAYEPVRKYTLIVLAVLGALYALALSLAALPGRVGRVALGVATDLEAIRGAIPKPQVEPEKPKTPPTIPPVLGALLLAISLAGCGHLPPVARIVVDAGCVATHYDELADAEQAGAGAFLVAVERVARKCGIERDVLVTIFGTHKQGRARAAMQPPAPACSSATLATPVRP